MGTLHPSRRDRFSFSNLTCLNHLSRPLSKFVIILLSSTPSRSSNRFAHKGDCGIICYYLTTLFPSSTTRNRFMCLKETSGKLNKPSNSDSLPYYIVTISAPTHRIWAIIDILKSLLKQPPSIFFHSGPGSTSVTHVKCHILEIIPSLSTHYHVLLLIFQCRCLIFHRFCCCFQSGTFLVLLLWTIVSAWNINVSFPSSHFSLEFFTYVVPRIMFLVGSNQELSLYICCILSSMYHSALPWSFPLLPLWFRSYCCVDYLVRWTIPKYVP